MLNKTILSISLALGFAACAQADTDKEFVDTSTEPNHIVEGVESYRMGPHAGEPYTVERILEDNEKLNTGRNPASVVPDKEDLRKETTEQDIYKERRNELDDGTNIEPGWTLDEDQQEDE